MPDVSTSDNTALHIVLYSCVLVPLSLLFAVTSVNGGVYRGTAIVLGVVFVGLAWRLLRHYTLSHAKHLYLYSLLYLALLFIAMMVDSVVNI